MKMGAFLGNPSLNIVTLEVGKLTLSDVDYNFCMSLRNRFCWLLAICGLFLSVSLTPPARASAPSAPRFANAYEVIDAVNALRARNGLYAYSINSILMNIAQAHSDYQAAIGTVTHYGPDGSRPYQRALAAGYPVANAITNPPGFYAENIQGGPGLTAQSVVNAWTGDSDHLNTMLSPNLVEVGAGVSCSGDYCYFTLDAARPSGEPVVYTPPGGTTTPIPGGTAFPTRIVVFPSTPGADGSVRHTVRSGETLFLIALAYKTTVDSLKSLNRLSSDLIYPGDVLLIFPPRPTETTAPTGSATPVPSATPFLFRTATRPPEPTATPVPSAPLSGGSGAVIVGIIIISALLLAGGLTALGGRKRGV